MRISILSRTAILCFLVAAPAACAVVEDIHVYFNNKPLRIVSAKRTDYFDVVAVNDGERLSEIAMKLTGSPSTRLIRAANPEIRSDALYRGTVIHIPNALLKPGVRLPAKQFIQPAPVETPLPQENFNPQRDPKDYKKGRTSGKDEEILPRNSGENYDDTPFRLPKNKITPFTPPKPTPDKSQLEEEKLRNKYIDIMNQLEK